MLDDEDPRDSQTHILKTLFPGKTKEEYARINRNFLKDAEPFKLNRLIGDLRRSPEGLLTGFDELDASILIPQNAITLITGLPKQGKSLFMMNMLVNMALRYKNKHFLFYSYEEPRWDIETKMINILGERPFEIKIGESLADKDIQNKIKTNLDYWKWKLKTMSEVDLLKLSLEVPSYVGLNNFLDISSRIHIIDSNYDITELIESIKLFNGPFLVGAVFIDYFQKIRPAEEQENKPGREYFLEISDLLRRFTNQMSFPLVMGVQHSHWIMKKKDKNYSIDFLADMNGLEHDASLIIGIMDQKTQKKRTSKATVKSKVDDQTTTVSDDKNLLLVKILANRNGPELEFNMELDPDLLRIESHIKGKTKTKK
jgi:replicative DNA helicase